MRTRLVAISALTAVLAAVTLTGCSTTPVTDDFAGSGSSSSADPPCITNYDDGSKSVAMTITNNTGQTLTYDDSNSGRADPGHWATRAPETLDPGECVQVTGYSDDYFGYFWLTATYRLPDGTYIPFSCWPPTQNDGSGGPSCNQKVFTSSGMQNISPLAMTGTVDNDWTISIVSAQGDVHGHLVVTAEPASSS